MIMQWKDEDLRNLLAFVKIDDLTIFNLSSEQRGGKNSPFGPRQTPSAKIGHVGVYFAKMGCKIEVGFAVIFEIQVRCFVFDWSDRWGLAFTTGLLIKFAAKREKWLKPFSMA